MNCRQASSKRGPRVNEDDSITAPECVILWSEAPVKDEQEHSLLPFSPYSTGSPTWDPSHLVALDCEMVGVGIHRVSVLARVSLVDGNGRVLFDSHVKVEERVTDYRTAVSGIRAADLEKESARSYGECRTRVEQLIRGKILVGHALGNDLAIMKLYHPWWQIRDTSQYPTFGQFSGRPRRLKDLTRQFLGRQIQNGEHDSVEDARAAMALYQLVRVDWEPWMGRQVNKYLVDAIPTSYPHGS